MARRSAAATQADITRMIKAAIAAGVGKEHIVIRQDRNGITLSFSEQKAAPEQDVQANEWDEVLPK